METDVRYIGRYKVEAKLGQGAMGVVYLARDEMIDRQVAIKSIRMDKIKSDVERVKARDLLFQEAKIIGKLSHSHIASIFDMGVQEENPYMVMEYVEGKTIAALISEKEPPTIKEKLTLISMSARALHYAHQRGVLHRDIKPANIMVLPTHSPKIMDFGISRIKDTAAEEWAAGADEQGIILGTPNYMSPEQIRGKVLDQRSDIFSLGVLTYEWLCGKKPFTGPDLKDLLKAVLKSEPELLSKIADIDPAFDPIMSRALAKDPNERYRNAEEFSEAIEIYLNKQEMKSAAGMSQTFSYDKQRVIAQLKKNYLFFSDFTDEELFSIFKLSGKEKYAAADVIVQEGTSGTKMYIIVSGSVTITKDMHGKRVDLKKLTEGDCFGELSIIDKMPRSASVIANEPTVVVAINEVALRLSNPEVCLKLYRNLAAIISEKLRWSDARVYNLLTGVKDAVLKIE